MNLFARISPRDRRMLAVGGMVIGTTLLISRGLPIWREWDRRALAESTEVRAEITNLEAQSRLLPSLRDSARARSARAHTVRAKLIAAPSVGSAGSSLATQVTEMADALGVKVSAVQIRPDSLFKGNHVRVAVRLTASGDVRHLADLLSTLESSAAALAVRELTVSPNDPMLPDGRAETLRFQILVEGLAVRGSTVVRQ